MKEKERVTPYMLELYHLNVATKKERKLIDKALQNDNKVRQQYEELKKSDLEIRNKYLLNKPPEFTVVKNNNQQQYRKTKKIVIGIAVAAASIVFAFVPMFLFFGSDSESNANGGIAVNETEQTAVEEEYWWEGLVPLSAPLPVETEPTEVAVQPVPTPQLPPPIETESTEIAVQPVPTPPLPPPVETEPVVIAALPNNDTGIFIRGGLATDDPDVGQNTITIPAGLVFIFDSMFANRDLIDITIPNRITFIGNNAFANNQIHTVIIPDSVTSIGSGAFSNNPLTSITIGANVLIEFDAFPANFTSFYNAHGQAAGTFTRPAITSYEWSKH